MKEAGHLLRLYSTRTFRPYHSGGLCYNKRAGEGDHPHRLNTHIHTESIP